jgi:16S rRNA C1402 (ribose-2'-O) methylase RsmI
MLTSPYKWQEYFAGFTPIAIPVRRQKLATLQGQQKEKERKIIFFEKTK